MKTAQPPVLRLGTTAARLAAWAAIALVAMVCFLFSPQRAALAAENTEFVLVDGTVVRGTLNSCAHGVYTIAQPEDIESDEQSHGAGDRAEVAAATKRG